MAIAGAPTELVVTGTPIVPIAVASARCWPRKSFLLRPGVIDISVVSYLDSASIGCLMDVHRLLQEKGGGLRLSGLQPRVETMISMTGVHKIVPLHREEEDALAAFSAPGGGGR